MPVNTVLGPVDSAELGQTLVHEHVVTADWSLRMALGEHFFNREVVLRRAVEHFRRAAAAGVRTVVDGTPLNMGRDVELIREVAQQTGLNFIVSSGFYSIPETYLAWRSEDDVYALLSPECRDGVAGSGVHPGIMKVACGEDGLSPLLTRVFGAIGRIAAERRLPIFVHHDPTAANGDQILDLLESRGVAPAQIVLGHSGDSNDLGYLERMLRRGCFLGMDRFGYCEVSNGLADRVRTIVTLCRRGYADRLLLSHDLATYLGVFGSWQDHLDDDPLESGPDFTFIHRQVLPRLEAAGLLATEVTELLVANPARLFDVAR